MNSPNLLLDKEGVMEALNLLNPKQQPMSDLKDYRDKAHHQVNLLFNEIEDLKKRWDSRSDERKEQLDEQMDELDKKQDQVEAKLKEFVDSTEKAAEDAKRAFDVAADDLKATWEKVKAEFKHE